MTDIHAHVLHRFDDGPNSLDKSVELLKSCRDAGITRIAATSHYYSSHMPYEEFEDRRRRRIDELRSVLENNGIPIELVPAAEVHMTEILLNLKSVKSLCYGDTDKILLEIPHSEKDFEKQYALIDRIMSYYNVIPVIAHIERYSFLMSNEINVDRLRDMGCFIQIDTQAIVKGSWLLKNKVLRLIRNGKVDFVASDCHGTDRPQNLKTAYEFIEKKLGKQTVELLKDNAQKLLTEK